MGGKLLTIFAVTSRVGLAMGQSIQCCANAASVFFAGVCLGEHVWWLQFVAIALLGVGIVGMASPGMHCTRACLGMPTNDVHSDLDGDAGAGPCAESPLKANPVRQVSLPLGMLLALASGLCMGFQAVPFKLSNEHDALGYALAQAVGQFAFVTSVFVTARLLGRVQGFRSSLAVGLPAGLLGGGLLFAAAACHMFAVENIGLIGSCLGNLNMVVAGTWGIVLFREITERRLIMCFFLGSCIALTGAFLLVGVKQH